MPVFVFGSNREGRHGKGAALHAMRHCGAIYGQAEGRQGHSYAIVTKEIRRGHPPVAVAEIAVGVAKFIQYAEDNPGDQFQVTPIGCGLAGFTVAEIAPLFVDRVPDNVDLPAEFASPPLQGQGAAKADSEGESNGND